jgi:O-antigen biosynthesis protein WbqP
MAYTLFDLYRGVSHETSVMKTCKRHSSAYLITRAVDVFFSLTLLFIAAIPLLLIAALIKVTSDGPVLHWSNRVGRHNRNFMMAKFRTMRIDTPQLASHLLVRAQNYVTPVGQFLRKSSLDELPQLWNILTGDLRFVGPRPALYNQDDLVELRTWYGVHELVPGVTGWAQVNGRDELSIREKVALDKEYAEQESASFDLKILALTILKVFKGAGISH